MIVEAIWCITVGVLLVRRRISCLRAGALWPQACRPGANVDRVPLPVSRLGWAFAMIMSQSGKALEECLATAPGMRSSCRRQESPLPSFRTFIDFVIAYPLSSLLISLRTDVPWQ